MGREVGKQILNIGVAVVIFAIIQPFIKHKIDFLTTMLAFLFYIALTLIGAYLIRKGERI